MPIPAPSEKEEQSKFMVRCMGAVKGEFKDNKQRVAVCLSKFRNKNKKSDDKENNKDGSSS